VNYKQVLTLLASATFSFGCVGTNISTVTKLAPDGARIGFITRGTCPPKAYACETTTDYLRFMKDRQLDLVISAGQDYNSGNGLGFIKEVGILAIAIAAPAGVGQGLMIGTRGSNATGSYDNYIMVHRPNGENEKYECGDTSTCSNELNRIMANAQPGVPEEQWSQETLKRIADIKNNGLIAALNKEINYHKMILKNLDKAELTPEITKMKHDSENKLKALEEELEQLQSHKES